MTTLLQTAFFPVDRQPGDVLGEPVPVLDTLGDADRWLAAHGDTVECLLTHSMRGASRDLMNRLPRLRLIANFGAGTDLIDLGEAAERDIAVTASGAVLTDDVADLAIWMILTLQRGNVTADAFVREGRWTDGPYPLGGGVGGHRLGILGFGRIGRAVASRARAMRMIVGYHSRRRATDGDLEFIADPVALARWADMLVVTLPAGAATEKMIDKTVIEALGPEGKLVNVARGSVIDEDALLSALHDGRLGGAALDVFRNEPHIDPRFLTAPRLLLSPHLGSATSDSRNAMLAHVVQNIRSWRCRKPLNGIIQSSTTLAEA